MFAKFLDDCLVWLKFTFEIGDCNRHDLGLLNNHFAKCFIAKTKQTTCPGLAWKTKRESDKMGNEIVIIN